MTDRWIELAALSGDDVLEIVQQAATAHPGAAACVDGFRARVVISSHFPLSLKLLLPDSTGTQAQRELIDAVHAAYAKRNADSPRVSRSEEDMLSFREAVILTVLQGASHDTARQHEPLSDELLLLDREPIEAGRTQRLIAEVNLHATAARWAQIAMAGANHLVFHVRSDAQRKATFESALKSGSFQGTTALLGYEVGGRRLFLPPSAKPSAIGLGFFHFVLTKCPELLGANTPADDATILAAIDEREVKGKPVFRCLPLHAVRFTDLRGDDSRITQEVRVEFGVVTSAPEAREQVRQWLDEHASTHGYRLRLRATRYRHAHQRDIDLLLERQMQIEDQLALLQNLLPPRPLLYRFNQTQLPLLAQALRSYAITDLVKDRIAYTCQSNSAAGANGAEPQFWHFLLIDPYTARETEPFIPKLSPEAGDFQTTFWLDPFWARYYPTSPGNVLLFVPEGQALSPTPHSWTEEEMDRYLREDVLGRWFHGRHGVQAIPERPLYVFDRGRSEPGTIEIAVLDQSRFAPVRQKLGWINSNLLLLDSYPELEEMVRRFADQEIARRHEEQLATRRAQVQGQFQSVARTVASGFVDETKDLTASLESAIGTLHAQTEATVTQLKSLHADLQRLIAIQADWTKMDAEARGLAAAGEAARAEAIRVVGTIEKEAQTTLNDLAQRSAAMKARVEQAIKAQRQTIEQLRRTLRTRLF